MEINRANMDAFFEELKVSYTDAFNAVKETSILNNIAMTVPSNSASVTHAWLNQIPRMREWVGDRVVNNIESAKLTVENKKYENTIEMPREDIEDDQHGLYLPLAAMMGAEAAAHPDKLCVDVLVAGASDTWVDDVEIYSASGRTYGDNTIANYVTSALGETTLSTAISTMSSYLGHKDDPLMVTPKYLLHGPALRKTAWDLTVNSVRAVIAADASTYFAADNFLKGAVIPIEDKRLVGDYANYWFVIGEQSGLKPLVYQQRQVAEFQGSRFVNDSDYVFETDKYQVGVRARGRAFIALPHLIYAGLAT